MGCRGEEMKMATSSDQWSIEIMSRWSSMITNGQQKLKGEPRSMNHWEADKHDSH
jgi:hypothetical protein